jgi:hypothetical protein
MVKICPKSQCYRAKKANFLSRSQTKIANESISPKSKQITKIPNHLKTITKQHLKINKYKK